MKRFRAAIFSPSLVAFHQMNLKSSSSPLLQQLIPDGYRPTCFNGKKYRQQYRHFHSKNENQDGNQGKRYLIGLGCFVLLFQSGMYYFHYNDIENTEIIQERNLTDGKLCKIYGKLDSNKVLKLDETYIDYFHEPVLIYEGSKEGQLLFESIRSRDSLRCYCDDLEVKFSHGKSDWFDHSSDLTDTLKIDLRICKIYTDPTREYSEENKVYNSHLGKMEKLNSRDSKTKILPAIKLFPIFKRSITQRVLNKGNQVILIGRVDAKSGVFKCEKLISPSEKVGYTQLNGETMKMAILATALFVVASWI